MSEIVDGQNSTVEKVSNSTNPFDVVKALYVRALFKPGSLPRAEINDRVFAVFMINKVKEERERFATHKAALEKLGEEGADITLFKSMVRRDIDLAEVDDDASVRSLSYIASDSLKERILKGVGALAEDEDLASISSSGEILPGLGRVITLPSNFEGCKVEYYPRMELCKLVLEEEAATRLLESLS